MKKLILFSLIFLFTLTTITTVLAWEESLIKVPIRIKWDVDDKNTARIVIEGENLQWSKTIHYDTTINNDTNQTIGLPSAWIEDLEIILIRKFGNYTDVQYAIMECNKMANFSDKWEMCLEQRTYFELQILNEMVNKSDYENLENNLSIKIDEWKTKYSSDTSSKDTEITVLTEERDRLTSQKTRWQWIGIIGVCVAAYLGHKYKGWGKRKQEEETELPKDTSV